MTVQEKSCNKKEENKRLKTLMEKVRKEMKKDEEEKRRKEEEDKEREEENLKQAKLRAKIRKREEYQETVETARLKIHLSDGTRISEIFNSSDPLDVVYRFIESKTGRKMPLTMISRDTRTFTEDDRCKTLKSLGLTPQATLTAFDSVSMVPAPEQGNETIIGFLQIILAPFQQAWNFVYMFLFGEPEQRQIPPEERGRQRRERNIF